MSVCQPTVPVLAAVSLMAARGEQHRPLTMTMMGGPIDARRSPTAVNNLAIRKPFSWFEQNLIHRVPEKYPGFMRRVYPGFLQHLGFVAMNPDRHLTAHWDYYHHLIQGDGVKFYRPGTQMAGQNERSTPVVMQNNGELVTVVWPTNIRTQDPVFPLPKSSVYAA